MRALILGFGIFAIALAAEGIGIKLLALGLAAVAMGSALVVLTGAAREESK